MAIAVVARAATGALSPQARVTFFRALGRAYLPVGGAALVVGLASGGVLLRARQPDALAVAALVAAAVLVVALGVAVRQARRMTLLRDQATAAPANDELASAVTRGGTAALALRALLGVVSVLLVALGCLMAA